MYTLAIDTETTGLDIYHGNEPFIVTTHDSNHESCFYRWDVDPLTRKVQWKTDEGELEDLRDKINRADRIAFQNINFDVSMLMLGSPLGELLKKWPYEKSVDTLFADHLLRSSAPHDLTSLALRHCNIDLAGFEQRMRKAITRMRNKVRNAEADQEYCRYRIARDGLPEMPSATENTWKTDLWLPFCLQQFDELHEQATEACQLVEDYADSDPEATLMVWEVQEQKLRDKGLLPLYEERLRLLPVIYSMQKTGVSINSRRTKVFIKKFREESKALNDRMVQHAATNDYELLLPKAGMNKSLSQYVFDTLSFPVLAKGKGGNPSLKREVLNRYIDEGLVDESSIEFIEALKNKRRRDTAVQYMESYQRFWQQVKGPWHVLHPWLNATGTNTLRFSSANPNEQNISKQESFNIRGCFGPLPGREWWSCDAKNIELRIPAYESEEQELIDLFEKPDEPPYYGSNHLLNFHTVYPDIWNTVNEEVGWKKVGPTCKKRFASTWYQRCKNGGFAVQYGAIIVDHPNRLGTADRAFHRKGSHGKLAARFENLSALNQKQLDMAEECGFVRTMPDLGLGMTKGYPLYCTRDDWGRIKPTVPLNYHVQGTAMWWMCRAMVRCKQYLDYWSGGPKPTDFEPRIARVNLPKQYRRTGFDGVMVMQVHDEIVFDLPSGGKGEVRFNANLPLIRELARVMSLSGDDIGVPTPVGIEYHPETWAEGIAT